MAAISSSSLFSSSTILFPKLHYSPPPLLSSHLPCLRRCRSLSVSLARPFHPSRRAAVRAVAEEEAAAPEEEQAPAPAEEEASVAVPVSPSDVLTMFFQAEGTMDESAIPAVTKALEGTDEISDLRVRVVEGLASVELTKQTTIQATGVASNLVEIIQGSGFKLQTLNLSFEDEEDAIS